MSDNIVIATEESFATEVLQSDIPVLVDFWAPWCGPCMHMSTIIEEVAAQLTDKIKVVKVNVDENQELSTKYNIRGIPNLFLFNNGKIIDNNVGAVNKNQLIDFVNKNIM